jgi:hypothetical protein
MTKRILTAAIIALLITAGIGISSLELRAEAAPEGIQPNPPVVLRHVVLFRFKEETSASDIRKIENAFNALAGKIDVIYDFEWGTDVSVENLSDGFTHCFFVTFRNGADRAVYLPHPEHKAFGKLLGPHLDKVIVVDYWTKP